MPETFIRFALERYNAKRHPPPGLPITTLLVAMGVHASSSAQKA
ncbi:hypothetical protein OIN59_10800 [Acidovorax sp. D2M1]|uniref:Transposase n=1 Tax=Acidovorax benzenivorans TaxID=2987520 RepID=A0ABT5RW41_9BURK|nr:hypothetical protein [Acidovorax benzenivorans]MDD2177924.1 hypothetical protein [Acidovorax benzenivorans]